MFDQMMDTYRKAVESTLQAQQDLIKQWTGAWPTMPGIEPVKPPLLHEADDLRKRWIEGMTDVMTRHRERLDEQYRAGIKTIEDAFRVGEAKDLQQMRRLYEELWRQSFDCMKTVLETHLRDVKTATEKWLAAAEKAMATTKS